MVYFRSFASDARDPLSGDRRIIFLLEEGKALVVKLIVGIGCASVEIHDTSRASLAETIETWNTRNRYVASVGEVISACAFASEQVREASAQVAAAKHEM